MRLPPDATPEEKQIWRILTRIPPKDPETINYYKVIEDPTDLAILMWRGELGYPINSLTSVLKMTRFGIYKRWVKIVKKLAPYARSKHLVRQ